MFILLHMAHISLIDIFVLAVTVCPLGRSENPVEMVGSASSLVFDRFQKFKKTKVSTRWDNLDCDLEFDLDLELDLEKSKKGVFFYLTGCFSVLNGQKSFKFCVLPYFLILYEISSKTFERYFYFRFPRKWPYNTFCYALYTFINKFGSNIA